HAARASTSKASPDPPGAMNGGAYIWRSPTPPGAFWWPKETSMKIPGPDHPITITPATTRWQATFHGHLIADSGEAVVLQEANYPPVVYFPRKDVEMSFMARTPHTTHCPYKGDATYFTMTRDGEIVENALW